jgi:hypothetical protein
MTIRQARLAVAVVLFVGWLGYLGYLALGHAQPTLVSRVQLMNSTSWVVAEVDLDESGKPQREIHVEKVLAGAALGDRQVIVANLPEASLPPNKPITHKGMYLIPLLRDRNEFLVTSARTRSDDPKSTLIYPWIPEVEAQLADLKPVGK